ncbi:MAG: hypothetical protein RIS29_558 [Bacteroidota bacterium]
MPTLINKVHLLKISQKKTHQISSTSTMRIHSFIFFLLTLSQISFAGTLSINGQMMDKKLNGQKVFIKERINKEWIDIDETTISNNKFSFQEKVNGAKIAYLIYTNHEGSKIKQAFVLEPGKLNILVSSDGSINFSGTTQNDLLQPYQSEIAAFNKKAELYYKSATKDSALSYNDMLRRSKQDEEINAEELSIHKKYANELINTAAGSYIFANSYYLMSTEEKLEILNKMNAQQLELKQIKVIRANVEIEKKVAPGNQFIDFTLNNTDNIPVSLSQYIGKTNYLLVEFWASWCPDCMRFLPQLSAFYAKHHGKMLEVVGVSLDENKQAWVSAIQRKSIPWVNISDLKGWKSEAAQKYAVSSIPCTFLIDSTGKIIFKNPGLHQLEEIISKGE